MIYTELLEEHIRIQSRNMQISLIWTVALFAIGIITTLICFKIDKDAASKIPDLMKMGPLFVTTGVSSFPCKGLMATRERLGTLKFLMRFSEKYESLPSDDKEVFRKSIEKILDIKSKGE